MKISRDLPGRISWSLILLVSVSWHVCPASAQSVQHLSATVPGGIPSRPIVTGVSPSTNGVTVSWDGPAGYYQLLEKASVADPTWRPVGGRTNLSRRAFVAAAGSNALFRVLGPAPRFVGSQACLECHQEIHDTVMGTQHAQAFAALKQIHQDNNPGCLPCHTVGYGAPTGFTTAAATPQLEGVQCENCHGPAGNHAANPDDPTARPRLEIAAQVCGGCHTGTHQPTFEEWQSSPHSGVVEDMNNASRIDSCGRCHSGSARWSMLEGKPLPLGDANLGIQCINCHEPHSKTANPFQLLNPVASTNDYFLSTTDVFTNKYDPNINVCAQCHNHRGASWTNSSRPPHHSPQYNMLLGTVGLLVSGAAPNFPASHALRIQDQCAGCHMQSTNYVSETQPASTGHSFQVNTFDMCRNCHPLPEQLVQFTTASVSNEVQSLKASLDLWAMTKAPLALRTNYGTRAWEYTNPGDLSPGGAGPNSAEQAQVPVNIQKARFNLYLVLYDGSFGVHNGPYAATLLDAAQTWIDQELNKQ
ncbi:MAG TPA: multiheme c-type cytochrome [Verrucomicrobiae bacterium]|nr:multiheme c-type cytochrome [Verrucomicrobiae bacterium]